MPSDPKKTGVHRFDRGELRKPVEMPGTGWLRVDGLLTRTGVFSYRRGDGSTLKELRLPEEVFHPEALSSFGMVPVTDEHPPEFLDSANAYAYARGTVGEEVKREGDFVRASLMVTDAQLAAKLKQGNARELSCGYTCDLEDAPGVTASGERYDAIQRRIRGNHVAIVPKGRAGPEARVRMDAAAGTMLSSEAEGGTPSPAGTPEGTTVAIKRRIDGVEYEVPEQAAQALDKVEKAHADAFSAKEAEAKASRGELEKLQAKFDAQAEELKKKDEALKAAPEKLRKEIQARADLEQAARKVLGAKEKLDGKSEKEIRALVLAKTNPDLKLDGKSDEYVAARFDLAIEMVDKDDDHETVEDGASKVRRAAEGRSTKEDEDETDESDEDDEREDSASAYAAMLRRNGNAWKKLSA